MSKTDPCCKTNVFVIFHKRHHPVCPHIYMFPREKGWKRMLASCLSHLLHSQFTLWEVLIELSFLPLWLCSRPRGSQVLLEPPGWMPFPTRSLPYSLQSGTLLSFCLVVWAAVLLPISPLDEELFGAWVWDTPAAFPWYLLCSRLGTLEDDHRGEVDMLTQHAHQYPVNVYHCHLGHGSKSPQCISLPPQPYYRWTYKDLLH